MKHLFMKILFMFLLTAPLYATSYLYQEDFQSGPGGFTIDNSFGLGNGLWHMNYGYCEATLEGHSGTYALAYADNATCNYNNGTYNQGVATSPSIYLPTSLNSSFILTLNYFLQTEGNPCDYDYASVEVSENGGPFTAIAHNCSSSAPFILSEGFSWKNLTVDLTAYAGSSIQLRFGFNTLDASWNDYAGFYIDDVAISVEPSILYTANFEDGLNEFGIDNSFGDGNGLWHLSTACESALTDHSATTSLAYAQDATCDYDIGSTNQGVVTSLPISLPANAPTTLIVNYFLATEQSCIFDKATIEVSEDGEPFVTLARNCPGVAPITLEDGSGVWQEMTADLSAFAGSSIQLRFGFETGDSIGNNYTGFYVDDIIIFNAPTIFHEDFENGFGDWTNPYSPGTLWHLSTVCESTLSGHSAVTTLAYADDDLCTYQYGVQEPSQGVVMSPIIDLPNFPSGTLTLTLNYFLETECQSCSWDKATIEVSKNGGPFVIIASKDDYDLINNSGVWQEATVDLSAYRGSSIQLRFGFDTVDGIANGFAGFYVDDVTITSPPCLYKIVGDANGDCRVNLVDCALMAQNWLTDCLIDPMNPGCVPAY